MLLMVTEVEMKYENLQNNEWNDSILVELMLLFWHAILPQFMHSGGFSKRYSQVDTYLA
jgi:Gpi18-like mannosyltransferase